jgi:histidinol-phosphate aminotransferase
MCTIVPQYPNLIVLQTLSKAFGLAGIRLGIAFASPEVANLLNCMKAPYNISSPASALAIRALSQEGLAVMERNVSDILQQRNVLINWLQQACKSRRPGKHGIGDIIGGLDANFLLVQIVNGDGKPDNVLAESLYKTLAETKGVVVRFRGNEPGCTGSLRITIGTTEEIRTLIRHLEDWAS